ncbi:myo-inositol-1(or 4)-monophosphatase [Litoreibacter meonggei]|uniref:Inositol-1-monophosphatase n=1 Tax=Litoreibacter meonggei TaxID=1049199 RepID=A0A497W4V7_9RHOB|nr:inositol monophosphatase [Litoreibacter meonggei]RLJ51501.1 myo-inositol-1(or 4)-monophosphatase [Litoreibacter meonggei]
MSQQPEPLDHGALKARAEFCRDLIASASALALEGFNNRNTGASERKGPQDFLTETDGAVERHIRARIAEAFPEDGFMGEETGGAPTARVWVVDPIDGTANFARGIPHFCVSIAFVADGEIKIGSICAPATDDLYFAQAGQGATRNGAPIHAAKTEDFDAACVELGWSGRVPQDRYLKILTGILDLGANVRRGASGAMGLAYVADGRSDAYLELHMNAWDCLAGLLLAQEAGARICDFLGDGPLEGGGPVIASVSALADQLSDVSGLALAPAARDLAYAT